MIILNILLTLLTFLFMEFVAWFMHKYVMHGFLWSWHKDHHQPEPGKVFERNDRFFLVFALPSMALMGGGALNGYPWYFYIGLGILLYGIAYFLVHEVFIHRRLKWFSRSDNFYLRAIRKAHKVHHKNLGKEQGRNFGMLLVPLKYFREARKSRRDG
ncbi:MAG: beta-carotene hydroxylase [Bacteroidetes bacterium]|nr:MAG: beta-carotene hydroxylase [Bacteroidota bacterium]